MSPQVWLTLGGAAAELFGLALVLLDARDARRHADEVVTRDVRLYVGTARARGKMTGTGTVVGGREPTLEERVESLEKDLPRFYRELDDRIDRVDDAAQEAAQQAGGEAKSHADDLDRALRDFISSSLRSSRSLVGVGFFVAGVAASAVANLI